MKLDQYLTAIAAAPTARRLNNLKRLAQPDADLTPEMLGQIDQAAGRRFFEIVRAANVAGDRNGGVQ